MKFNKSLLVSTLVASSVLLAACNEKNKAETKPSEPAVAAEQTAKQEQVATEQPAVQDKVATETAEQVAEQERLNLFNNAISIKLTGRQISKNEQGEDIFSFSYDIQNKSNKAIKEVQWFNLVILDSTIVDVLDVPAVFEKHLAAQEAGEIVLSKLAKNYSENVRDRMLKQDANLQFSPTIAGKIVFEDGSQVVVTTIEDIAKHLQQISKK